MTDDTEKQDESSTETDPFEVKWRKKNERPTPPSGEAVEAPSSVDASALDRELEEAQGRIKDLQDRCHRAQADLANLRRRTEQERGEMEQFASMMLVAELLPVLDNFERALQTIPGNLAMLTWIHGIMLIERHFQAILEHQGLQPIEAVGQRFNPQLHEAINEVETTEQPEGTVVQEYQKGYTMHGRVIRPALVEVARAPAAATEPPRDHEEPQPEETGEAQAETIADEAETENVGP